MRWKYTLLILLPLLSLVLFSPLLAQNEDIILTVAIQEWQQDAFSGEVLAEFQAENPGIKVVPVFYSAGDDAFYGMDLQNINESLDKAAKFAATADVLQFNSYQMSVELTRAGYLLDMTPLLNSDGDALLDDFYPALLRSFQWEGGTWALPISGYLNLVIYEKTAFDAAGQPYPDENWTLTDFINAGKALTVRDENGNVLVPGFYGFDERILFRALLGHGLYDPLAFPETPRLNDPALAALMEEWDAYQEELFGDAGETAMSNVDYDKIPLTIQGLWRLSQFGAMPDDSREWGAALLPGGLSAVYADGFGISSGTLYPEAAYKLVQFLTKNAVVVNRFFGDTPARRSLVGIESDDSFIVRPEYTPEVQALVDLALENGLPASEMRYFDYLWIVRSDETASDLMQGLQKAQELALDNLEKAAARRGQSVIAVPTPVPTPVLAAGEISLNFLLLANMYPIPNRDKWGTLIQTFVENDPEVGQIVFNTTGASPEEMQQADCYYMAQNIVPFADLSTLLPLDPLLASDPAFDEADFMANTMTLVTRDGRIWALPINIQPAVLWYNRQAFADAGAFEPYIGWTMSDFEVALRTLKTASPDIEPFAPSSFGNSYLLMLIAAYGGLPVDYRTDPPTFNLTDPMNVEAMRQVLNLAKDKLIKYRALESFGGGGGGDYAIYDIYDGYLSIEDWRFQMRNQADGAAYSLVTFPRGTQYQPVAFSLGAGYINATTQYPEACYRWLSAIVAAPEVYSAMPARRSMLDNPTLAAVLGEDVIAMFHEFDTVLLSPDILVMPGQFGGSGSLGAYIMEIWMNRAFDNYVLEAADLETELQQAQAKIDEYAVCVADLPKMESVMGMSQEELEALFNQYVKCGLAIDPSLESRFPTVEE